MVFQALTLSSVEMAVFWYILGYAALMKRICYIKLIQADYCK
jgi:hypothetical protein